ncbi:hypothetical protein N7492_006536 [Penicillium capsulatum]|uniref:Uncharacterized protein n=1 Tax=Penicillium capsulatum TaxID=69766 RepID=A0A9W9HY54_9EURO|nr:hypothetical protein N7492_006536 [Penicillium capsulatum]KAJ6116371.1 hypothetical protein N7512_006096 [Penicillium capsulatum]
MSASSNPSFSMSAYFVPSQDGSDSEDEVASLPSESTTDTDLETLSEESSDAEAEWRENIQQLELLLGMVIVPFVGKMLGRRMAYWSACEPVRGGRTHANHPCDTGWNRFMEWKYPVEIDVGSSAVSRGPAPVEAAPSL